MTSAATIFSVWEEQRVTIIMLASRSRASQPNLHQEKGHVNDVTFENQMRGKQATYLRRRQAQNAPKEPKPSSPRLEGSGTIWILLKVSGSPAQTSGPMTSNPY